MKKTLLTLACLWTLCVQAQFYYDDGRQLCGDDSIVTGNYNALGINPADIARCDRSKVSIGLLQIGGSFYTNVMKLNELLDFTFSDDNIGEQFKDHVIQKAKEVGDFKFDSRIEINWLAFSISSPKWGGIAVNLQDRMQGKAQVPSDMVALLLEGEDSDVYKNSGASQLFRAANGTDIFYNHIRELNVGYGCNLVNTDALALYGGITLKRLWGIGHFNADVRDVAVMSSASFSEFYDFDFKGGIGSPAFRRKLGDASGKGWGFDVGLGLVLGKKWHIGLSLLDMGQLTWDESVNTVEADFTSLVDSLDKGWVDDYLFRDVAATFYNRVEVEEGGSIKTPMNSHMRFNTGFRAGSRLSLNADITIPVNTEATELLNVQQGTYAAGMSLAVLPKFLHLNLGGYYTEEVGARLPVGIMFNIGGVNMLSISTTDLLTFISDREPLASLSVATVNLGF